MGQRNILVTSFFKCAYCDKRLCWLVNFFTFESVAIFRIRRWLCNAFLSYGGANKGLRLITASKREVVLQVLQVLCSTK